MLNENNYIKYGVLSIVASGVIGLGIGTAIPIASTAIEQTKTASISDEVKDIPTDTSNTNATVTMDEASKNTVEIINKVQPSVACITSIVQGTVFLIRFIKVKVLAQVLYFTKIATMLIL